MSPMAKNTILLVLTVSVWTLNALMIKGTIRLSAKLGIPVEVEIEPARVRLMVDGQLWDAGTTGRGWIQTPTTIRLPAGQHKMVVERPGYALHSFKVLLTDGDNLQLRTALEAYEDQHVETEILGEGDNSEDITAIVDGGLAEGQLPLRIDDLTAGQHTLELRLGGLDGMRSKPYFCAFTVPPKSSDRNLKITVARTGKRLRASGCKRIKAPQ